MVCVSFNFLFNVLYVFTTSVWVLLRLFCMKSALPTGKPKILMPFVVSLLFVNSLMHCCISVCR